MSTQALILKRLAEEGAKTATFFRALTAAQLETVVYATGPQWRAREVLAHLVSAERTFHRYGQEILAGGEGAPEDFVIDEYNAAQVAGLFEVSPTELIAQFEIARTATIELVTSMTEADLARIGRHPWFGRVALAEMLKLIYRHTMLHERDVRKAVHSEA